MYELLETPAGLLMASMPVYGTVPCTIYYYAELLSLVADITVIKNETFRENSDKIE